MWYFLIRFLMEIDRKAGGQSTAETTVGVHPGGGRRQSTAGTTVGGPPCGRARAEHSRDNESRRSKSAQITTPRGQGPDAADWAHHSSDNKGCPPRGNSKAEHSRDNSGGPPCERSKAEHSTDNSNLLLAGKLADYFFFGCPAGRFLCGA